MFATFKVLSRYSLNQLRCIQSNCWSDALPHLTADVRREHCVGLLSCSMHKGGLLHELPKRRATHYWAPRPQSTVTVGEYMFRRSWVTQPNGVVIIELLWVHRDVTVGTNSRQVEHPDLETDILTPPVSQTGSYTQRLCQQLQSRL